MNCKLFDTVICLGLPVLTSCIPANPDLASTPERMTQISVINALMVGRYDGLMTIPDLLREGDFGIGTLDHLDGELIILDGKAFQGRGDGKVVEVGPERSTPFAAVTHFDVDGEIPCREIASLKDLDGFLDHSLPQKNNFVALRVDGSFSSITFRSVHRQEPPYKPLAEVSKTQSVWTHENLEGTLVGIRCPSWVGGLNVPGYHWHFLSNDRKVGGHVLDCRLVDARVKYDVAREWLVKLDESPGFNEADLGKDQSKDLKRVESSRGESNDAAPPESPKSK